MMVKVEKCCQGQQSPVLLLLTWNGPQGSLKLRGYFRSESVSRSARGKTYRQPPACHSPRNNPNPANRKTHITKSIREKPHVSIDLTELLRRLQRNRCMCQAAPNRLHSRHGSKQSGRHWRQGKNPPPFQTILMYSFQQRHQSCFSCVVLV